MTSPQHAEQPVAVRPRLERWVWILWAGFAVVALLASWALIYAVQARHAEQRQREGKTAAVQAVSTANSRLHAAGLPTVSAPSAAPVPTVTVTITGQAGPAGPGPSTAQIQVAVDAYCSSVRCDAVPTAAQVAQAVASYCNRKGECRGPAGQSVTGPSGAPGQNATADQVADAVATYCGAHNQCAGPEGPSGAPGSSIAGPSGAAGQPPYSWTYTDALGVQHSCSRTDPFDASAPTYSCD